MSSPSPSPTPPAEVVLWTPVLTATPAPTAEPAPAPAPPTAAPAPPAPEPPRVPAATAIPAPPPSPPAPGWHRYDMAAELVGLLNTVRQSNGLPPVAQNGILTSVAESFAAYHFTHGNPYQLDHWLDGLGPGQRAWSQGYCCSVGEILATAEGSAQSMVDMWMNSPPHRAIILDGAYNEIGAGCYQGPHGGGQPVLCAVEFGGG